MNKNVNKHTIIENEKNQLNAENFFQKGVNYRQEQVKLLTDSFLSDKENQINVMYNNILRHDLSWDKIKTRTITYSMLTNYKQKGDLPLNIQDAIMRKLASKILLNLTGAEKKDFADRFDSLLRSKIQIDIKTLEEFKPFLNGIDKKDLEIGNEEIFEFLNDNKVTNINPLQKIGERSIYDKTILMEVLYLQQKTYFEKNNKLEGKTVNSIEKLMELPDVSGINRLNKPNTSNYEKVLKEQEDKIFYIDEKLKELDQSQPTDKDSWQREDNQRHIEREKETKVELKKDTLRLKKLWTELNETGGNFDEKHDKILDRKQQELDKIDQKIKKLKETKPKDEYTSAWETYQKELENKQTEGYNIEKDINRLNEIKTPTTIQNKKTVKEYLEYVENSDICETLKIDKNQLKLFVKQLEETGEDEKIITIKSKAKEELNLKISKTIDKDNNMVFSLDLNDNDPKTLKWLESPENEMTSEETNRDGIFYSLFAKNGEIRYADGYKIKIDNKYEGYLDYSVDELDFPEGELRKKHPELFDTTEFEDGHLYGGVAFLRDESNNLVQDKKGNYIFVFKNNVKTKTIDVIDRKISLKGDKTNLLIKTFYAWSNKSPGIEGIKKVLKFDESQADDEESKILDELINVKNDIDIGEPSYEEVKKNANINSDEDRKNKAKELLQTIARNNDLEIGDFENNLLDLILFAHYSTEITKEEYNNLGSEELRKKYKKVGNKYYEIGKDKKRIAGIYNYTTSQLKEKVKILRSTNSFEEWQIKALLIYGICGIDPDSVENKNNGKEKAQDRIQENIDYYYDGDLDEEYAYKDAEDYYNELNTDGKKAFLDELKNTEIEEKEVEEIKNNIITELEKENNNKNQKEDDQNQEESIDLKEEKTEHEKFMDEWNTIGGHKEVKFEPGTRLFMDIGGSTLPPEDVESCWLEIEIVEANPNTDYFRIKIIGSDVKTDLDGKTIKLSKTEKQISDMKASGNIFKLPSGNKKDWNNCIDNVTKANIFEKLNVFGSAPSQVQLKNGKLLNGDGEKVTHFCRTINTYELKEDKGDIEQDKMGQTAIVIDYEVETLKNGKIKVKCNFDQQNPDDFSKDINYKYEKEMDYTQFILLMESKQLYGYTKKQKGDVGLAQSGQRDPFKGRNKMYSIMSIIEAMKGIGKNMNEKIDAYRKEQAEDFEHVLCSKEGLNLYGKIGGAFGLFGGLFEGMEDAMKTAELEYYADRENRTWKKIEKRYNLFEKDPHFSTQWKEKLNPLLTGKINERNRFQHAAGFIYMMKKDGPWNRKLIEKMGKGFWIEKFLGKKHKERFLEMQHKRKTELEEYKRLNIVHWRNPRHSELSRLEFDYMVGVIDGRQPFGGFGPDDEHYQASRWSRPFAEKIQEGADDYFGSFDEKYKKIGRISFRQAEQEWFRHMANMRPHKALPFLKAMAVNAQSRAEEDRVKSSILGAMLSGVFKNMQDHNLRGEFWRISRTMGFLPGIWCRDTEQQENALKMLDGITSHPPFQEKFSKVTGYKLGDFQIDNTSPGDRFHFLLNTFPRYWKANGKQILKILQFQDRDSKNSVIKLAQTGPDSDVFKYLLEKSREFIREDIDEDVAGTYGFYEHSPLTANKGIISGVMPSNGKFEMTDNNMKEAAQLFWTEVGKNDDNMIPTKKTNKGTTEFIFGKYFNWLEDQVFTQGNLALLLKGLSLAKKMKEQGRPEAAKYYLWYITYGQVAQKFRGFPPEFARAMDRFYKFFVANIEFIDTPMVENVCNNKQAGAYFDESFEALPMKEFWSKYMIHKTKTGSITKYRSELGSDQDRYINWQIDQIHRDLERLNIKGNSPSAVIKEDEMLENQKKLAGEHLSQERNMQNMNKKQFGGDDKKNNKDNKTKQQLADALN